MNNSRIKIWVCAIVLLAFTIPAWACPVCERNQPKILKGVVHGQSGTQWDYVIVWVVVVITVVSLFYSIKWLIRPGEGNTTHIKYSILNEESI